VTKITEILGQDRLRVGQEHGMQSIVLQRSQDLLKETLKVGDEIRVDPSYRIAIELLSQSNTQDYYLEAVPEISWDKVGGQAEALSAIKDAIELPLLHADLFSKFQHQTPKGFLLYGPPGCGKTLLGKATAYNLTRQLKQKTGEDMLQFFMHIKGPEILNMWVVNPNARCERFLQPLGKNERKAFSLSSSSTKLKVFWGRAEPAVIRIFCRLWFRVLHRNGRDRVPEPSGHYSCFQPRRSNRPSDSPAWSD